MLILNINGPINSGKTTVSKILVNLLPNATFIEVDELMSDEEEAKLGLSMQDGWAERQKRLNETLLALKQSRQYETIIFAYPISENSYQKWASMADENTRFINVTLAPSLEECLKNRGERELDDWERNRITEMYEEGYQNRPYSDFIINNDNQTPKETAEIIKGFLNKPECYLICGFLGAGKTTYSQKLSKETGAIHLNPDEWCMKLFSKEEYEQNWSKCFSETIEHLWKKAEEYAKNGKSVIFDMGFWTKLSRDEATQRAKDLGFNPAIHFLNVPDEILKQRISARKGTIAEYNLKHFDELKKQFEVPTKTEKYVKYDNY